MSRMLLAATATVAMFAGPAFARNTAPAYGVETTIRQAGNGGLRDWTPGAPIGKILYVRDRFEHWYEVTLTGPCVTDNTLDTLAYTTDTIGTFDRFSSVRFGRYPYRTCGVVSIRTSPVPPDKGHARHG